MGKDIGVITPSTKSLKVGKKCWIKKLHTKLEFITAHLKEEVQ